MSTNKPTNKSKPTPTQARASRRERRHNRRRITRWLIGIAISLVAALLILGLFLPMLGNLGDTMSGVPEGPGEKFESQGTEHIEEKASHPPYNSIPATSGWHYSQPFAPVKWGIHKEFIPEEKRIHNLEHGGISVAYDPAKCDQKCINDLVLVVERAREENLKVLLSPYPNMDHAISLTAWTFLQVLDTFDKGTINKFITTHESSPNAPERFAN